MAVTSALVAGTSWLQWQAMETQTTQNETIIDQMRAEQEIMKQQTAQTDTVIEQMRPNSACGNRAFHEPLEARRRPQPAAAVAAGSQ
jgi:hypothetical protein